MMKAIGPFNILSRLGSGGMGEVYLAQDSRLGRKVALKILPEDISRDQDRVSRFRQEAKAASALNHPNVATIYEAGESGDVAYIAMEYVEGETLAAKISGCPLASTEIVDIASQVADALDEAHSRGITHRDIKSANIMLTNRGQAKVLDFGLAKLAGSRSEGMTSDIPTERLTVPGIVMGTVQYMSPEQALGKNLDHRTDIFSFGVVMYEMVTGRLPFTSATEAETIERITHGQPEAIARFNYDVPEELVRIIRKCLEKDRERRYQTARELLVDLKNLKRDSGSGAPMSAGALIAPRNRVWRWTLAASAVFLAGVVVVYFFLRDNNGRVSGAGGGIKSIAVLPFKPLVEQSRDEALELGMADSLIARLSNIRQISVRPVSAVRKYAGLEQDALAAGREQKVDAVLEGNIQRSGENLRVTVRLVQLLDGSSLWAGQFDEKFTNIFAVQDSISERVAGVLALTLTGQEKERLKKPYTENTEAYELYLKGRFHANRLTDDGFLKSLEYFQQAIEKDPNFALAHAGLAGAYNALAGFNVRPPKEVYPKARSAALTALNLDHLLARAHTELAMVNLTFDWDWAGAEREFKRAIEISPSDSDAHYYYSYYLAFMGKFDNAISEIKKAQEFDPISLVKLTGVAQVLLMARRYDEALEHCEKALEMDPNLGFAHWLLGLTYLYKGSYEPAIRALQQSIPLSGGSPDESASLAHAYALAGKRTEALKILEELKQQAKRKFISPGTIAYLYGALGERDQAFALLDKAVEERDNMVVLLKVEPMFDPLRSDSRFAKLLRRIGFPE
jgi:TolB-like protein/Flp pilus assembly protein TadD/predicted Ser/Thr protein kinase